MDTERPTPRADGFAMPAERERHETCLMERPTLTRKGLWGERFEEAKRDYAEVATAIAAFEPVVMACDPDQEAEARRMCGETVEVREAGRRIGPPIGAVTFHGAPGSGGLASACESTWYVGKCLRKRGTWTGRACHQRFLVRQ